MDEQLEAAAISDAVLKIEVVVTSSLFEAFMACPTKCRLLYARDLPDANDYTAWAAEREDSYWREGVRKLTCHAREPDIASQEPGLWKNESWQFAIGKTARAQGWEADLCLVHQIDAPIVPLRRMETTLAVRNWPQD